MFLEATGNYDKVTCPHCSGMGSLVPTYLTHWRIYYRYPNGGEWDKETYDTKELVIEKLKKHEEEEKVSIIVYGPDHKEYIWRELESYQKGKKSRRRN